MEKSYEFWNRCAAVFAFRELKVADFIKITDMVLSTMPIKLKKIDVTYGKLEDISKRSDALKYIKENKGKVKVPCFFIYGFLLNKEAEVEISKWADPPEMIVRIRLQSPEWLKASKDEKVQVNKLLAKLAEKLKPTTRDYDTEYEEMAKKINENGFVV